MKKFNFFSIYILINGIVLALVVGMSAAAFSMSPEGLLILEAPTAATTSANTRGAMVAKVEVEKDKIKKAIKPVVGGCELWTSGGYFRIKSWGSATSSFVSSSPNCLCPASSTKILLSSTTMPITNLEYPVDEWRLRYNVTLDQYCGGYECNTTYIVPVCTDITNPNEAGGRLGIFANSLISTNTNSTTSPSQFIFYNNQLPPRNNWEQTFGYCYMNNLNFSSSVGMDPYTCCCDPMADCPAEVYNQSIPYCNQTEALAQRFGIPWDRYQVGPSAREIPSACGLVIFNHNPSSSPHIGLPSGTTSTVEKFICIVPNNGWDNNWGLP